MNLQQLKGMQSSRQGVKGVSFVNRRYTKRVPFSRKMVLKRGKGLELGAGPSSINIC